jgi:photosystem II stability/assembly factor-like uncharacterized protein
VIVNDVLIDPRHPSRLLLATDRGGALASDDGGATFSASNRGFSHRQVAALLVDRTDSSVIFAGLLNDKEFGGAFVSRDRGQTWRQINDGLDGRDVLVLRQAADNSLIAGTDRGVFQLRPGGSRWLPVNRVSVQSEAATQAVPVRMNQSAVRPGIAELAVRVTDLELTPQRWFAATSSGFLVSSDSGLAWRKLDLPGLPNVVSIAVADRMVVAATRTAVLISANGGESWLPVKSLYADFNINSVAVETSGNIWLAAREGVFRSTDMGDSWKRVYMRLDNVCTLQFDQENQRILATGAASNSVYESLDNGRNWSPINSGWPLRGVSSAHGRLLGITPFDGVVIQPETSASSR